MKMIELFKGSNKAKTGLLIGSVAIVSGLGSAILFNGFAHGEWDMLGLQQQVQYLTEKSDNHEARITNVENQVSTPAGSPTPTPQVVTQVVTQPAPASVGTVAGSQPAPVEAVPTVTPVPTPRALDYYEYVEKNCATGEVTIYFITRYSDSSTTKSATRPTNVPHDGAIGGGNVCTKL